MAKAMAKLEKGAKDKWTHNRLLFIEKPRIDFSLAPAHLILV